MELHTIGIDLAIQVERTFWQVLIWQWRRVIPNAGNRRTSDTRQ